MEYEMTTWEGLYQAMLELAQKIVESSYKPDVIVGIARGGWMVARIMSDLLNNSNVGNIKIEYYVDVGVRSEKPIVTQPVSVDVRGKRVLLVDDVADTGESLKVAVDHLKERGASEVRVATIHYKPWSVFEPDYWVRKTEAWVIYRWELAEFARSLLEKMRKEGKSIEDVKKELVKIGFEPEIADEIMEFATKL